jgi:hypothetical protein
MSKILLDAILARLDALEATVLGQPRRRLSKTELARQEGCTPRTVMRKVEDEILPPPDDVINGRLFWWSDSVERHRKREADTRKARAARDPRRHKGTAASPET